MNKLTMQALLILAAVPGVALANPPLPVPEPSMLPLLGLGIVAAAVIRQRRK